MIEYEAKFEIFNSLSKQNEVKYDYFKAAIGNRASVEDQLQWKYGQVSIIHINPFII